MRHIKHWQDAANAVLGVALILSPWVVGYAEETVVTTNAVVVGLALVAAAFGAMLAPQAWEEWTEALLGLWMMMSPWVLDYNQLTNALLLAVAGGLAVVVLAVWTLVTDNDVSLPKSMQP